MLLNLTIAKDQNEHYYFYYYYYYKRHLKRTLIFTIVGNNQCSIILNIYINTTDIPDI